MGERTDYASWGPPVPGARCQALDDTGRRCRRLAHWRGPLFSDPQISRLWVTVELCKQHAAGAGHG